MFIKGLISSKEYDKLRAETIHIEPQRAKKSESVERMMVKEKKCRRVGIACLSTGAVVSFVGVDLMGTAYSIKHNQNPNETKYVTNSPQVNNLLFSGITVFLASLNFWTAGAIELGIANKYRKKMNNPKLKITPAVVTGYLGQPSLGIQAVVSF